MMASPALARSPLITLNQAGGASSPYAKRAAIDHGAGGGGSGATMLYAGGSGNKNEPLLSGRGR